MKRVIQIILILLVIGLVVALLVWPRPKEQAQARLEGLPEQAGNFDRAVPGKQLVLPRDLGPHDNFQTEWWYYTGNLDSTDGRHYGFQLTFFRRAILSADQRTPRPSDWAAEQVYMAHFTLTDVSNKSFRYFERFSRGAAGLAGAQIDPSYKVWLENWSVESVGDQTYRLRAQAEGLALDLTLRDVKGPILQGDQGYSPKGPEPGNASYYISQTRLDASGTVTTASGSVKVQGSSWMDHEFSTSSLGKELVGWDWFALQLSDGSELMFYHLRRADGSIDPFSNGTLIRKDGSTRALKKDDFQISNTGLWKSPHSGATYPSGWKVEIPSEAILLEISPYLQDQELRVSYTYWEGAVKVQGSVKGAAVTGNGYVELTGYAGSMQGEL